MGVFAEYDRWRSYPEKMTPEEAKEALSSLVNVGDLEVSHSQADEILCALLRFLGRDDIVGQFNDLEKWYA